MRNRQRRCMPRVLACAFLVALVASSAAAQTTFDPVVRLWFYYADHIEFVGEGTSDSYYRLELELPVRRQLRNGFVELSVASSVQRFERETSFDNEGFRGILTVSLEPGPHSSLEIRALATRTQDQPLARAPEDPLLFLTPRAERDFRSSALSYGRRISERWSWDLAVAYSDFEAEFLGIADGGALPTPTGDYRRLTSGGGVYRELSRRTSLGVRYQRSRFELEMGAEETNDILSLHLRRQLSPQWSLGLRAGGYRRSGTTIDGTDLSESGPEGELILSREFRRIEFEARASSEVSAGGALLGTSNLELLELALLDSDSPRWSWYLFGRLARRVPSQPDLATVDLEAWGAWLEVRVRRLLGVRFDGSYAKQSGDAALATSLYRIGVSVAVYPLGRTRLAGHGGDDRRDD